MPPAGPHQQDLPDLCVHFRTQYIKNNQAFDRNERKEYDRRFVLGR